MKDKLYFYFVKEKMFIWILGYARFDRTNVVERITVMLEYSYQFVEIAQCELTDIHTYFVTDSNRYKYMDILYCYMNRDNIPVGTFVIENATMVNWLR